MSKKRTFGEATDFIQLDSGANSKRQKVEAAPYPETENDEWTSHDFDGQDEVFQQKVEPDWAAAFGDQEDQIMNARMNQTTSEDENRRTKENSGDTKMDVDAFKLETEAEMKVKNEKEQEEFQKNLVAKFLTQVDLTVAGDYHISKSNKAVLKKEEQMVVDTLLKQGSLPLQNAYKYTSRATLDPLNFENKLPRVDLKKTFLQARHKKDVEVSYDKQASRFPVYKDVSRLWHYDYKLHFNYKAAEKKRFRATQMFKSRFNVGISYS